MAFDLGSYDFKEDMPARRTKILSWRLDPVESLSDWTIIVTSKCYSDDTEITETKGRPHKKRRTRQENDNWSIRKTETYHVHKAQLAVGSRQSDYFARLFRNNYVTESVFSTSTIELHPSAAMAFPAMLDFVYSVDEDLDANTENAVALRYLSNYFGVSEMFKNVNEFIQKDLSASTAPTYLAESAQYHDEKITAAACKLCVDHFSKLDMEQLLILPPDMFTQIVCSPDLKCESKRLSTCVSEYCRTQPDAVTKELLDSCNAKIPVIEPSSSLFLLTRCVDDSLHVLSGNSFQKLYDRCVEAASTKWRDVLLHPEKAETTENKIKSDYHEIPDKVKIVLLECALRKASEEFEEIKKLEEEKFEMRIQEKAELCTDLQKKLSEENQKAAFYASELGKFVRVPNSHDFEISTISSTQFSRCTYKESRNLFSTKYGKTPPTLMPTIPPPATPSPREGWIFHEKRENVWGMGSQNHYHWPVFYYKGH